MMILYQKTLGCGCKLQDYGKGSLRIKYCPKHAAIDELLEALEKIGHYPALSPLDPISALDDIRQIARDAIANARLIAAAPDLLEALTELAAITDQPDIGDLWYFIGDDLYFLDGIKDANKKARATIAQATTQD